MTHSPKIIPISVGIFCHNEETNVTRAISSVLESVTSTARIVEVIVVSSGSFDRTNRIVRAFARKDKRVRLIDEAERNGKSSAINLFLHAIKSEVSVSMSGDLWVKKDAIEEIVLPFLNPSVGMVGAHPKPLNYRFSEVGTEAALLWELHHAMSLTQPKCGEMVAFRNVIRKIPIESAVDEANLEVLLRMVGFSVVYAPRSIVYNKVPLTVADFLLQRRRVRAGHLWLSDRYNYQVVTMQQSKIAPVVLTYLRKHPTALKPLIRLVGLEALAWFLGWMDYSVLKKNPYVWDMVER